MILADATMRKMINTGRLTVSPMESIQLQPASIDIRLGTSFSTISDDHGEMIEIGEPIDYDTVQAETYDLLPGHFVLATTVEYIKLPDDIAAFVEGRSSLGRMGLFIQNAGWVDPGFKGEITFELFNASDKTIRLHAGKRIGQLVFAKMDRAAENPYQGKYQGQTGATGTLLHLDEES